MTPRVDTIKASFTYFTALILIVGGLAFLYATRLDNPKDDLISGAIIGFIGAAIQFVFSRETQTQTARQIESATMAGQQSGGS